jgi:FkbM family methyltransferase
MRIHRKAFEVIDELRKSLALNKLKRKNPVLYKWAVVDKGDSTHSLNCPLDENSIVFDVGGFKGEWASRIFCKYCPFIYIFEPVSSFAEAIKTKFSNNKKVFIHQQGLAADNAVANISLNEEGSSIYTDSQNTEKIELISFMDFVKEKEITKIDLMKINIEGGEYELLNSVIESGFIGNITNLKIQFHNIDASSRKKMEELQRALAKTHELTYQYDFLWENWELKK